MVKFSIIIPSFNREEQLTRLLACIDRLNPNSPPFEVVVVDDGSSPRVKTPINIRSYEIRLLRQENAGPAQARNLGAKQARGEYLIFIDDDCLPHSDWLVNFEKECDKSPSSLLAGHTSNGLAINKYSLATQLLIDFLLEHYSPKNHVGGFYPTNNMLVPKSLFLSIHGFNPSLYFGEDREFCYRWGSNGLRFDFARGARVEHYHALNFLSFIRLHFNYGKGTCHFRQLARKSNYASVGFSMPNFYLQLILSPLRQKRNLKNILLSGLLLLSQVSNIAGVLLSVLGGRQVTESV